MSAPSTSDREFLSLFERYGATKLAQIIGVQEHNIYKRRKRLEREYGEVLAPTAPRERTVYSHRQELSVKDGVVLVGSDFHIWPGSESTALRAFKKLAKDLKPAAVILNGDVLDFPQISRHPPIGWESAPSVKEEIEAAQDHLQDIATACGKARKIWTLGNHDARFETRLATVAREYKGLQGIHLSDFFGLWEKGWSCLINGEVEGGRTMVKHRFKGGQSAPRANTLNSGIHMVTGHLHSQKVIPVSDYLGDRYGIDTGCVADKDHKAFIDYTEDAPLDWRSGFGVLTYKAGKLLYPELVTKWDASSVQFRGQLIRV